MKGCDILLSTKQKLVSQIVKYIENNKLWTKYCLDDFIYKSDIDLKVFYAELILNNQKDLENCSLVDYLKNKIEYYKNESLSNWFFEDNNGVISCDIKASLYNEILSDLIKGNISRLV